jgi:outer membrane protein OmpA-like peptidoglycan-associated protein
MTMSGFKRSSIHRGLGVLISFIFFTLLVAGCAPSQQDSMAKDQLERARSAYAQAKSDRNVEAFAPVPFADAGKALQDAEKAKGSEQQMQLAYIAERRAQIATATAEGKMAERDAEKLAREKSDMMAEKRSQEARIAKKEAEQAKAMAAAEAERAAQAKAEAARAQAEAEQARMAAKAEAEQAARSKAEAEQAKADADKLMKELSDLKAKQTERGMVLTLGEVLFATGKSDLSEKAIQSVEKLAEFLLKYTNRNVLIEGHTDSTGSDQLNMTLSQKRADAVKAALTAKGVSEGRITTRGYGKKYPVGSNDTPGGRSQNRRVEVLILNEGVKPETQFRDS